MATTQAASRSAAARATTAGVSDDELRALSDEIATWARRSLRADAMRWNEGEGDAGAALHTAAQLGLLGALVAERHGGAGLGARALVAMTRQLACVDAGLAWQVATHAAAVVQAEASGLLAAIARVADPTVLPMCWLGNGGRHLDAIEPSCQADVARGTLRGALALAPGAALARVAVLPVAIDEDYGVAAVDLLGSGVQRRQAAPMVGLQSIGSVAVAFDDAPLLAWSCDPAALAPLVARLSVAAAGLGVATGALEHGVRYTLERAQFNKPIAHFQPIQWQTADSATELAAASLLLDRAAGSAGPSWVHAHDAIDRAYLATFETARRVSDRALQWHGGAGYTLDFAAERYYRDASALPSLAGTALAARARIAARLVENAGGVG